MALLRCRGCEGTFKIHKGSRSVYCPYCGMKQTLPEDDAKILEALGRTANTLKRGFMLLEDGEFEKADECFDRVLDSEPENGRAYLGRLMANVEVRNDFELAERLKDGLDDLDAWRNIDAVNALLSRALQFAPDEMRSVFSDDYHDALFLMKRGSYRKALAAFWNLRDYHPDAVEKAKECSRLMHTTVDEVLEQESKEYEAALSSMHEAGSRALDLSIQNFNGKYSDSDGLAFVRREIAEILEAYYKGFEVLGREQAIRSFRQDTAYYYRELAFSAEQLVLYLDSSYIDYVKADEKEKREFLDDVYRMLDEACTYLEQHDKYNSYGSEGEQFREDLRSGLEKHKPVQETLHQAENASQDSQSKYEIRNTKSMPKWLMWLLITVFGGFFVWMFLDLFISVNAQ